MTYLKKVFKQINSFYKLAQTSFTMSDDADEREDLDKKLVDMADLISDSDMRTDLALIIQKYREAKKINGGYNDVIKSIDKFIKSQLYSIDEDDAEYDAANDLEEVLLDISKELEDRAKAAGGGINRGDTEEAHAAITNIQNQFEEDVREHELSGGPSTSDLSQFDPNAVSTFDFSGGVDKETGDEKGRGWHGGTIREPKDWINFYTKEKEKYLEDIKTEKNPKVIERKQALINVLDQLIMQTKREIGFYEEAQAAGVSVVNETLSQIRKDIRQLKIAKEELLSTQKRESNPQKLEGISKSIKSIDQLLSKLNQDAKIEQSKPQIQANSPVGVKLSVVRNNIKALKAKRSALRAGIRNNILQENEAKLKAELNNVKTPAEKLLIEQQIELQKALMSTDANKGDETKARKALIAFLPHMSNTPAGMESLQKLMKNIEIASAKKISREELNRQQAEIGAKNMAKIKVTDELQKQRKELGLPEFQTKNIPGKRDFSGLKLSGYIENLSKALIAERKTPKDRLVGTKNTKVKEEQKIKFKPYLDAIASASNLGDKSAMLEAVKRLRKAVSSEVPLLPAFSQYLVSVRLSKNFHEYKDALQNLKDAGIEDTEILSPEEAGFIRRVIERGKELSQYFAELEVKSIGPKGTNVSGPSGKPLFTKNTYATIIDYVNRSTDYLADLYNAKKPYERSGKEKIDPETGEIIYE